MTTPPRREPLGKVIVRADSERARAAQVGPADVIAASDLWRRHAPPGWQGLLNAKAYEPKGGEQG